MKALVVLSHRHNPAYNMALEEVLFHEAKTYERILFLYVNSKSVIFGRNQNPYREIDVTYALKNDIPMIRRLSGGGTVYHDLGNLNFSFIEHQGCYDEHLHFRWIMEAVSKFGISLELTSRKDLILGGKKISGNAFYMKGNRRLHHGTLLVNANLDGAHDLLMASNFEHVKKFENQKSVVSVPSPVVNMSESNASISMPKLIEAIIDVFYKAHAYQVVVLEADFFKSQKLQEAVQKYQSTKWNFGETPIVEKKEVVHVVQSV